MLYFDRYSPTTILNLLKEVAQSAGPKLDWDTLVKYSNTGISSAREYQMLWRYLAYKTPVLEKLETGAEPLVCFFHQVSVYHYCSKLSNSQDMI